MLIPSAAHGTNPATAVMCGYKVREIPGAGQWRRRSGGAESRGRPADRRSDDDQSVHLRCVRAADRRNCKVVHEAGGLLYYDGANLNAILGKVRPGDMGFDVLHMNLHKTFATPHGGGGPGAGPVGVGERLLPYLPTPMAGKKEDGSYSLAGEDELPHHWRLSAFMGNAGVLLRAFYYGVRWAVKGCCACR
jgi:glycine dehydrogenase subunit 2